MGHFENGVLQCQTDFKNCTIPPYNSRTGNPTSLELSLQLFQTSPSPGGFAETMKLPHSTIPAVSDNDIYSPGPETQHLPQSSHSLHRVHADLARNDETAA